MAASLVALVPSVGRVFGLDQQPGPSPVSVSAGVAPSTLLFPGGKGDVTVRVSNPNPFRVRVGRLVLNTSAGSGGFGSDKSGCNLSALRFTPSKSEDPGWLVPARAGSTDGLLSLDLKGAIRMSTRADNACQGATFSVFLTWSRPR